MKEKKCYSIIKQVKAIILIIAIILTNLPCINVQAETTSTQYVENIDFSDFSNWRSGVYSFTTGVYAANNQRLCLNDYVKFKGTKYKVHISNSEYRLLIRELDSNKNYINSYQLSNGQEYKPGTRAVYLAIGIYRYAGEHGINYTTYKNLFSNGFVAELVSTDTSQTVTGGNSSSTEDNSSSSEESSGSSSDGYESSGTEDNASVYPSVEETDFTDFANWRTGIYSLYDGTYGGYSTRICLKNYVTFEGTKYTVNISNTAYHMLIREMDENLKFIKSNNLANGATFIPSSSTVYLGICLYNYSSESGITYTTYKNLFANGFTAKLTEYKTAIDVTEDDLIILDKPIYETSKPSSSINGSTSSSTNSSTNSSVGDGVDGSTAVYNILKRLIQNADTSKIDISAYNVTYSEYYGTIIPKLKEELYLEYHSYYNLQTDTAIEGKYVVSCRMVNIDSDGKARVERVREVVNTFLTSVDSRMSDVEKVLLAHEYVVNNTVYKNDGLVSHTGGCVLGNGYGVCEGYAEALMILLHELDIETDMVVSSSMDHAWVYVKLDGMWYHIDPTWNDVQDKYRHRYLIRNDQEMGTVNASRPHSGWICETVNVSSVSTKYSDWFVHDVYGTMYYYNGMWYYWDNNTNSILCSDIMGKTTKTVVDGTSKDKIKLSGISGNKLSYYIGTTQYTISL